MVINVGKLDRTLRFFLGLFIVWLGLIQYDGINGNITGILLAVVAVVPFYMVVTRSCFVFRWFKFHSLSKTEHKKHGAPYSKN